MNRTASRMPRGARALTLIAALLLGLLYVTPLWSVRLVAPQYPEGIGMLIRLHTVEGMKEHDLRNINSLNHYIGMKPIEADAIPELRYMPWIAAGLIASGVGVALFGRRRLLAGWIAAFALLALAGLYDFYRWGHDYGHNLDLENAIIVVPDMTYQPPLIGTKQLLNFTATSLPATGALLGGVSMLLAGAALFLSYRQAATRGGLAGLTLVTVGCAAGQPTLALGVTCVECRMPVSDTRFGAVLETGTGKRLSFDALECLLEHLRRNPGLSARQVWVAAADAPGTLVRAENAKFVRDGSLRPPMGAIVSYGPASVAGDSGVVVAWADLHGMEGAHAR